MAKDPFNVKSGGNAVKKLILCLFVLGLLVFLIKYPADAANAVAVAKDSGGGALDGIVEFFRSLGNR